MAIIYTYPDLGAVDGTEKLLVSDGSDENNNKTVTTATYGAYINATYGGGGGSSIYQADGSITANRQLSGSSLYSLTLTNLTSFNVGSPTTFSDTVQLDSTVIIPTGAVSGRVLTTDDAGLATWQAIPDSTILTVNGTTNRVSVTGSGGPNPVIDIDSGYVGQASITTLGTIATGTWNGTAITELYGGTGQTGYTAGDLLYSDSLNSLGKLSVGAADKVLVGGTLPSWGNINNSHWSGTALSATNGGTGQAGGYTVGDILYASGTTALSKLSAGSTVGHVLTSNGAGVAPSYQAAGGGSTVTSVTGTAPVVSSGGTTPAISMAQANSTTDGYLRSTDWVTFDYKNTGLFAQTADSATVTGVTETSIVGSGVGSLTVPANGFDVGDSFKAKIGGIMDGTTNDITVNMYSGAVLLATTGSFALTATISNGWELELDFTIRTVGASGSVATNGNFAYTKSTDKKVQGYCFQDTQTIDTTVSNTLDIKVVWGQTGTDITSSNFTLHRIFKLP